MSSTITTEKSATTSQPIPSGAPRITDVQPYLFFGGRCDEAIEFYRRVLGAEVTMLMRFKDNPDGEGCGGAPVSGDKVMHASIQIGSTTVLASDGCEAQASFQGFSLSLTFSTIEDAERVYASLSESGQVQQPLTETFFAKRFGMVADKFGVSWMVVVMTQQ